MEDEEEMEATNIKEIRFDFQVTVRMVKPGVLQISGQQQQDM